MQAQGLFHRGNPRATPSHSQRRTSTGRLGEGDRTAMAARRDGQRFGRVNWMPKIRKLPNEEIK